MKYTVITGAKTGIGYEAALAFAGKNKNLIIVARNKEKLEHLEEEIKKINPDLDVIIKVSDLSVSENVYKLYEDLKKYTLETWINNAGFGNTGLVKDQNLEKIEAMLHLNIEALTILSTLFIKDYSDTEGSQLINVSSVGGYSVVDNNVTYSATKFYVSAFTEGAAQELKKRGGKMQVKVLAPAATETEFANTAMGIDGFDYEKSTPRFHTAKEMAEFLMKLYESDKSVGIVDIQTYEFKLTDPVFNFRQSQTEKH